MIRGKSSPGYEELKRLGLKGIIMSTTDGEEPLDCYDKVISVGPSGEVNVS